MLVLYISYSPSVSFLMIPPPPISTLFPYTTLFRSPLTFSTLVNTRCNCSMLSISSVTLISAISLPPLTFELTEVILTPRSEEHTSELQSHSDLVCRLLLEKKNNRSLDVSDSAHTQS